MYQIWKKSNYGKVFYVVQNFFKSGATKKKKEEKKKNVKKIGQFLEAYILHTTNPISFKFLM